MKKTFLRENDSRRGFTLVELLVVIAIIGILIGLLLPAVQAAREAARRMKCSNNMKQLALAMHNYHDVNNAFPAANVHYYNYAYKAWMPMVSAKVLLLPFMEQQQLWEEFDEEARKGTENRMVFARPEEEYYGESGPYWADEIVVNAYVCPSDSIAADISGGDYYKMSKSSICLNAGDAYYGCGLPGNYNYEGSIGSKGMSRGMFRNQYWHTTASCTDGTSNTLCAAETCTGNYSPKTVKGGLAELTTTESDAIPLPNECLNNARKVEDRNLLESPIWWRGRGYTWFNGETMCNCFTANVPPNSPNCTGWENSGYLYLIGGAQSNHPGGVSAAMMDGSVRFIQDSIDCGDMSEKQVLSGKSPYGVWGAMATPKGGESRSL